MAGPDSQLVPDGPLPIPYGRAFASTLRPMLDPLGRAAGLSNGPSRAKLAAFTRAPVPLSLVGPKSPGPVHRRHETKRPKPSLRTYSR